LVHCYKIQEVKPLLSIKRENADWEKIALRSHYQLETINHLLEIMAQKNDNNDDNIHSREYNGTIKIFSSKEKLEEAVIECSPLSGIVDNNDDVWIAFRPTGLKSGRSCVSLIRLDFDDNVGKNVEEIIWMSPIAISGIEKDFQTLEECCDYAVQYTLLLPQLSEKGNNFTNMYYVIGHNWTERISTGKFQWNSLNLDSIFKDWVTMEEDGAL
jgi:hypothetical protein